MVSFGKALFVAAVAALAFATLMVVGPSQRVAQAAPPAAADGDFWVYKNCPGLNDVITQTFTINVELTATDPGGVEDDFDETVSFALGCDEARNVADETAWADFAAYITANTSTDAAASVTEVNIPDLVTASYSVDCSLDADAVGAVIEATDGFLCTVTNDIDLPDLIIEKECPNGFGGSPSFGLSVEGITVDDSDADDVVCSGTTILADLLPGIYVLEEVVLGDDDFITIVTCDDATGPVNEQGLFIAITLDLEDNVECTFINALTDDDDGLIDINNTNNNIINVNSENTNDNANNNNNANDNNNENENDNNNENTNTQNQTNDQSQTNNNDQSTNVTSSPQVNISGAGAGTGSVSTGGTGVTAPSTGDGGLLNFKGERAGMATWTAVAGVLTMLGFATARYVRER